MDDSERPELPMSLRVVAWSTILCGVGTLLTMIFDVTEGRFNINFAALQIPGGFGLLRLSRGWRKFQLYILWICMVGFGIALVALLFGHPPPKVTMLGPLETVATRGIVAAVYALLVGFFFWQYRVLTSLEVKRLFGLIPGDSGAPPDDPGRGAGPDGSASAPPPGS